MDILDNNDDLFRSTSAPKKPTLDVGGDEDVQIVDDAEKKNLSKGLGQRHVQMIAIAGAIVVLTPDTPSSIGLSGLTEENREQASSSDSVHRSKMVVRSAPSWVTSTSASWYVPFNSHSAKSQRSCR